MITLLKKNSLEPTLTEAITCGWATGFQNHGPIKTNFDWNERVWFYLEIHGDTDLYTRYIKIDLVYNDGPVYPDEGLIYEHTTDWWTYRGIPGLARNEGPGTGRFDIYLDDGYIGSSNDFNVAPIGCSHFYDIQANCIRNGCYWYNDTCNQSPP